MTTKIELETGGTVWKLMVQQGAAVTTGDTLFIMEVMKMEVPYEAPVDGQIEVLNISEGDVLEEGTLAIEIG